MSENKNYCDVRGDFPLCTCPDFSCSYDKRFPHYSCECCYLEQGDVCTCLAAIRAAIDAEKGRTE
jgi:hypothetical protein